MFLYMADNQQEKIIRFLKGRFKSMDEVSKKMDMSRANLYIKFKEVPLDEDFVSKAKEKLKIDLSTLSNIETKNESDYKEGLTREYLLLENQRLHSKLEEILEKKNKDKDKIIELMEKINALNEKLRKLG